VHDVTQRRHCNVEAIFVHRNELPQLLKLHRRIKFTYRGGNKGMDFAVHRFVVQS
jgi:hypothetical protein